MTKKFIPASSHKRAQTLAMIPLFGTILFYVLLQLASFRAGFVAIALCPILMLVIYYTEAQQMPARPTLIRFIAASAGIAIVSIFALIGYELWGIYAYELGGASNTLGQNFVEFFMSSLSTPIVWSDYIDKFVWGFVASIVGCIAAWVWATTTRKRL